MSLGCFNYDCKNRLKEKAPTIPTGTDIWLVASTENISPAVNQKKWLGLKRIVIKCTCYINLLQVRRTKKDRMRADEKNWRKIIIAIGLSVLSVAQTESIAQDKWQDLFDGATLNGWHALPGGSWQVEDGILVGKSEQKEEHHGVLVSNKEYKNFEIEVVFKSVKGNSGLYFRVDETGDLYSVAGFQAEIHPEEYVGGIYETSGRGWVVQPNQEEVKKYNKVASGIQCAFELPMRTSR